MKKVTPENFRKGKVELETRHLIEISLPVAQNWIPQNKDQLVGAVIKQEIETQSWKMGKSYLERVSGAACWGCWSSQSQHCRRAGAGSLRARGPRRWSAAAPCRRCCAKGRAGTWTAPFRWRRHLCAHATGPSMGRNEAQDWLEPRAS